MIKTLSTPETTQLKTWAWINRMVFLMMDMMVTKTKSSWMKTHPTLKSMMTSH